MIRGADQANWVKPIRFQPYHALRIAEVLLAPALIFHSLFTTDLFGIQPPPKEDPRIWALIFAFQCLGLVLFYRSLVWSRLGPTSSEAEGQPEAIQYAVDLGKKRGIGLTKIEFVDEPDATWKLSKLSLAVSALTSEDPARARAGIAFALLTGREGFHFSLIPGLAFPFGQIAVLFVPDRRIMLAIMLVAFCYLVGCAIWAIAFRSAMMAKSVRRTIELTGDEDGVRRYLLGSEKLKPYWAAYLRAQP